jgi:hypothetical protein
VVCELQLLTVFLAHLSMATMLVHGRLSSPDCSKSHNDEWLSRWAPFNMLGDLVGKQQLAARLISMIAFLPNRTQQFVH